VRSPECYCIAPAGWWHRRARRSRHIRVWVDLANSPHVPLLEPIVARLEAERSEVILTARDHAQTIELARRLWSGVIVVGGASPASRGAKALAIARRANALRRLARRERPDVAFSHGSYAQIVAARAARVPVVTMMDFEHQPANHLSFRLAQRVIVPELFPEAALRRFGASRRKVLRYPGFKEDLYLAGFEPDPGVLDELGLDPEHVIVVFRPPPEGALYHPMVNERFEEVLRSALSHDEVQIVLLPRTRNQAERYRSRSSRIRVPEHAVDARSLLALADAAIGGGGTMNRESALLGTPTYTVFAGSLAAVDAELIRRGHLGDLRDPASTVTFAKKTARAAAHEARSEAILEVVIGALQDAAEGGPGSPRRPRPPRHPS
jgi:predicted glycosyltransferase